MNRHEPWPSRYDTANVSERHCVEMTESDPANTSVHQPCHPRLTKEKSINRLAPLDAEHFPNFIASLYHGPATPNLDKTILLSTHIHTLSSPPFPSQCFHRLPISHNNTRFNYSQQGRALRRSQPTTSAKLFLDSINPQVNKEAVGSRRLRYQPKIEMRDICSVDRVRRYFAVWGLSKRWKK